VVIPLSTSAAPNPPLTIGVICLGKKVVAVCDQIRAVDKSRLLEKADMLSLEDIERIEDGLRQVLCL
jgi:mRNA interferase MazF